MYRLGLRLSLKGGKEALVRLLLTVVAVGVGVTILLAVAADFNAFQTTNNKPHWEGTMGMEGGPHSTNGVELWNYTNEIFKAQTIERLGVAQLTANAPVPPGITKLPGPGQFYASPALASLLKTTPRDELGDRFPGTQIGTIGEAGLTSPDNLTIYIGYKQADLAHIPSVIRVNKIESGQQTSTWTNYFRYAFAVGIVAFIFPILILIGTATRLAAARREERYSAMRLVGATPHQINIIASVDAVVSSLIGTIVGIGLFLLLRSALADSAIVGYRYFANEVTPTVWGYIGILLGVPIISILASLVSLRRVRVSPLGVSRRATPPAPNVWTITPLLFGIVLFVVGVAITTNQQIGTPVYPGLIIIMIGLLYGGSWLTFQAGRLLAKIRSASTVLAARRLADNPRTAFRSVSGLVLAVFLGTLIATFLPVIQADLGSPSAKSLSNVLIDGFLSSPVCGNGVNCPTDGPTDTNSNYTGLPPQVGTTLVNNLQKIPGATVIPIYTNPSYATWYKTNEALITNPAINPGKIPTQPNDGIISCAGLAQLHALGTCSSGAQAVSVHADELTNSNAINSTKPIVNQISSAVAGNVAGLSLRYILVKTNNNNTLERVRTYLALHTTYSASGLAPRTFGEVVQAREALISYVQRLFYIAVALTLFVAGCSLAVAVGGSMIERKRPFTLLRVSGISIKTLYRVVLYEAVLPLFTATVVAAGVAYGVAAIAVSKVGPKGTPLATPGHTYYILTGVGLLASLGVILLTLPLLEHMTRSEDMRFE